MNIFILKKTFPLINIYSWFWMNMCLGIELNALLALTSMDGIDLNALATLTSISWLH